MDRLKVIVKALDDKRATNIDVLDISEISSLSDYFVICTCNSGVQVRAAADEVEVKMKELGEPPLHTEGYGSNEWVLLDYGSIIVHVFYKSARDYYKLERLWADGTELPLSDFIKEEIETDEV